MTFKITGGELPRRRITAVTDADGMACVPNLVVSSFVGNYTVTETVPAGYHVDGGAAQTVAVAHE